ncbi:DNA/RNA non-specific endonuclease [Weissella confusa]|uniref:DNA/RNA non-specific endonuclease n=1 Tax=Weissella confusa TaxID=1583 RepID=UPI00107FF4D9|nr:DNA/RNA non-specific endonuclease [Weissella confusa]MBJ7621969.1 DNA/RNA non-specific endonuclease [Weissella confusa]MBJ7640989.1 DNA/RNA non-specific endonuclease [Weissella confusa]MBJ7658399.1 DNA/RNA non-specific endonuclease [Weissella confusa]MBU5285277.1 DNA/RNA non-specific endonuclease [Weissella confusa]MCT0041215.1 DNA/RNA non-specific endonuclease [Weissella confusa]
MGRKRQVSVAGVVIALGVFALQQTVLKDNNGTQVTKTNYAQSSVKSDAKVNYGSTSDEHPNESLASSVLTANVVKQLGTNNVRFNGNGAFILNDNKTDLNAKVSSAPYVQLAKQDSLGRAGVANALLTKASRQYQSRDQTGNSRQMQPVGWHQLSIGGNYKMLYNRGHSIGYALAGSVRGFDASEANPQNITAQTAWANQASNGNDSNTGQNYYETQVRRAQDNRKTVRYRVTPVYDGDNLVPSGSHLEAKSSDGSLEFNVFVPNVEPGVVINYSTGYAKVAK